MPGDQVSFDHLTTGRVVSQITISAQDDISKIPEYKVCAVRVFEAEAPPEYADQLQPQQ